MICIITRQSHCGLPQKPLSFHGFPASPSILVACLCHCRMPIFDYYLTQYSIMQSDLELALKEELISVIGSMKNRITESNTIQQDLDLRPLRARLDSYGATSELYNQIKGFIETFRQIPGIWAKLFLNEKVHSPYSSIELGDYMYAFFHQLQSGNSSKHLGFYELIEDQIQQYVLTITEKLVKLFSQSKSTLTYKVKFLNLWAQKLEYTNKYIIFKVLKELSSQCCSEIKDILQPLFVDTDPATFERFVRWVIEKHQLIQLRINKNIGEWIVRRATQTDQQFEERFLKYLEELKLKGKDVVYTEAQRQDGMKGLLIIERAQKGLDQKYLVFSDDFGSFAVMNCALLTLHWRSKTLSSQLESVNVKGKNDISNIITIKDEIISQMRGAPASVTKIDTESIQNVGASLGKCLANFQSYDSVNSFIKDFTKKTAISGSLTYMVLKMPVLGKLLIVGGFSYTLYNILTNDYKNNQQKLSDIGKITIKTSASLGGGLIGAAIGQALIPIPLVGMFVGGAIGGFLSTIGSKKAFQFLKSQRSKHMYEYLKSKIKKNGSWDYSQELLNMFGMKNEYFQKSIPADLPEQDRRTIWMSALCFCLLSYFQSKNDQIQMQKQLKKSDKGSAIIEQMSKIRQQNEQQSTFVSPDLQNSIMYLQEKGLKARVHLEELVSLMMKIVQQ